MALRGILIANPKATTTSSQVRDIITRALAHEMSLNVITTEHKGHAKRLASTANVDLVITLGGDGTINEVVNGLLESRGPQIPMLAAIPGGSANVMARALGFPNDAIEATGMILESLRTHTSHEIGLGNAVFTDVHDDTHSHWFTINAGLGLDAAVIEAMEAQRAKGRAATPLRYVRTGIGVYARDRERTKPALTIEIPGQDPITDIALVITQNTAPWTFLGPFAVNPCPKASFDRGLDVFAPHSLGLPSTVRFGLRMLRASPAGGVSGGLTALHDISEFSVHASRPTALQIDGDGMGNVTHVDFKSVPQALRILG